MPKEAHTIHNVNFTYKLTKLDEIILRQNNTAMLRLLATVFGRHADEAYVHHVRRFEISKSMSKRI